MPEVSFFADLSIVIVVAAIVGLVFSRLKLPMTVGYILAGIIVGPHVGPALISSEGNIKMLSDLGVMFLMFSIGLGFSFRRVRQMGGTVAFPAIWDVCFMVLGGFLLGRAMGWGNVEGFLLGMILCDSSTSIAAKTLEELGWLGRRFADNTFAIALIEDVLAILLIAVLNGVAGGTAGAGADFWGTAGAVGRQLGVLALFLVGVTVAGILFVPRLMNYVTDRFGDEIVLMAALGICFGVSCLAQEGLNLSLVVGAFLAGAVIAEARARRRIERAVKPVTNLFGAVFFVSVGLMVNPAALWANLGVVLFVTAGMIVLKLVNCTVACVLVGEAPRDAFKVGIGMGQVAEFAFLIAALGMRHGLSHRPLYQIAVGVALLCTATNPYLLRTSDRLYALTARAFGPRAHDLLRWYRRWGASLRSRREGGQSMAAHLRGHFVMLGVDLALVLILFVGVYIASRIPAVADFLAWLDGLWQPFAHPLNWSGALCAAAALLLSAPLFWATHHTWGEIAHHIAEDAFAGPVGRRLTRVRRFVRDTLRVVGLSGLIAYAAFLCNGFIQSRWLMAALLLAAIAFIARFSKRFRRDYKASHATLSRAFDVDALPPEDPVTVEAIIAVHTETVTLPRRAAVAGKTLGELNLRHATGASVISVSNHHGPTVSPGRDTCLTPGATLVLVGSDDELSRATALLTQTLP